MDVQNARQDLIRRYKGVSGRVLSRRNAATMQCRRKDMLLGQAARRGIKGCLKFFFNSSIILKNASEKSLKNEALIEGGACGYGTHPFDTKITQESYGGTELE